MSDEALIELIKATRDDVVTIRDNHLAHINEDIASIREVVNNLDNRLTSIESLLSAIKGHWWKVASLVIGGLLGIDMVQP
jgi:hypothetical protein